MAPYYDPAVFNGQVISYAEANRGSLIGSLYMAGVRLDPTPKLFWPTSRPDPHTLTTVLQLLDIAFITITSIMTCVYWRRVGPHKGEETLQSALPTSWDPLPPLSGSCKAATRL